MDFIASKCWTISEAVGLLSPERLPQFISKFNLKLERTTLYSSTPRNSNTDFGKPRTWLFLFPSLYGFVVFFFFIVGFIGACREVYTTTNDKITTGTYTITFFKIAIRISIIFLWLILLIAGVLYFLHIPTAVVCGAIKKDKMIDRYLDRPYWKNETWIMSKLSKYVHGMKEPITVKRLLVDCRQNKTILQSLHLEKNISYNYESQFQQVVQESKVQYAQVIRRQPATSFEVVIHYLNFIDNRMDMNFIAEVENDLSRIEGGVDLLQQRILNMNLTHQFLLESGISGIRQLIMQTKHAVEDFIRAKFLVHAIQDELFELEVINDRLDYIRKNELSLDVSAYLTNITEEIICVYGRTETFIKDSLLHEFGNCNFLPYIYDKLTWLVCDYGLELVNSLWLSLTIIGFSIIIATILACKIACYIRGSYKIHGKYLMNYRRYSDRQPAIVSQMITK